MMNFTSIAIRRPVSAGTIARQKDGSIMVKTIKSEWLNTHLITPRRAEDYRDNIVDVHRAAHN